MAALLWFNFLRYIDFKKNQTIPVRGKHLDDLSIVSNLICQNNIHPPLLRPLIVFLMSFFLFFNIYIRRNHRKISCSSHSTKFQWYHLFTF